MSQPAAPQAPARKLNLGRLEKLQRLLQIGAALVLLVFVALIALAWTQLRNINAQTEQARLGLLQKQRDLAAVTSELEQKQNALKAVQSVNHVLSNVADAYKEEHPEKAELVTNAVRNAVETSISQTTGQGGQEAMQVPPRIYIQIVNAGQRARAAEVARRLQAKGFLVPGVENMERKGIRQSQSDVRFNPGDEMAAADTVTIHDVLGDFGVKLREVKLGDNTRPRQYELWLGDDFAGQEGTTRPELIPGLGPLFTRPTRPNVNASTAPDRKTTTDQKTTEKPADPKYPGRKSP